MSAAVAKFVPRRSPELSAFAEQMMASLDLMPLAYAIFSHDQFEKRLDRELQFYPVAGAKVITPEQRGEILDRAMVAHSLGDPAKRAQMNDAAAMAILRGVQCAI